MGEYEPLELLEGKQNKTDFSSEFFSKSINHESHDIYI